MPAGLITEYRNSKSAWLHDFEHRLVNRVIRRISYMTELNLNTAEQL